MGKIPWLNLILLFVTIISTTIAGAFQVSGTLTVDSFLMGFYFSVPLLLILGIHELGHYFTAKNRGIKVSLPLFIPAPTMIGTFGAVIKMEGIAKNRKSLLLVGAMGPISGFLIALPVMWIGLSMSKLVPLVGTEGIVLGDSLLVKLLVYLKFGKIPAGMDIYFSPVAFAGWIGFLVTALNLLPASQLDGGHIIYSLFPKLHGVITKIVISVLFILGIFGWLGWIVWAVLVFLIGRKHPPTLFDNISLDNFSKTIALLSFLIFVLTFIPFPFKMN